LRVREVPQIKIKTGQNQRNDNVMKTEMNVKKKMVRRIDKITVIMNLSK
jgi:hypothetical protein